MDTIGEWGRGYRGTSGRQPMDTIGEWGRGNRGTRILLESGRATGPLVE